MDDRIKKGLLIVSRLKRRVYLAVMIVLAGIISMSTGVSVSAAAVKNIPIT